MGIARSVEEKKNDKKATSEEFLSFESDDKDLECGDDCVCQNVRTHLINHYDVKTLSEDDESTVGLDCDGFDKKSDSKKECCEKGFECFCDDLSGDNISCLQEDINPLVGMAGQIFYSHLGRENGEICILLGVCVLKTISLQPMHGFHWNKK